jgi:hypothetical protein
MQVGTIISKWTVQTNTYAVPNTKQGKLTPTPKRYSEIIKNQNPSTETFRSINNLFQNYV